MAKDASELSASSSLSFDRSVSERLQNRLRTLADVGIYTLLLLVTRTLDQGDTGIYAEEIATHFRGERGVFWEFGHALWRPLGYVVTRAWRAVFHDSSTTFLDASRALTTLAIFGGLVAVVLFGAWLRRLGVNAFCEIVATAALASAAAFLGYAQSGSSYIPALAMVITGMFALAMDDTWSDVVVVTVASFAFALAVLLWFPMVLAVPGAALSTILCRGGSRRRWIHAMCACVLSGTIVVGAYVGIASLAGVRSLTEFRVWAGSASHGIAGLGGLPRAIVGFGRSILNVDRLGLIAKRHFVNDPYNPSSWGDVARAGLLRLAALYAFLGVMILILARTRQGRRALALMMCFGVPVIAFALLWQGGDLERYLALFPGLFTALAVALSSVQPPLRTGLGVFAVGGLAVTNVPAISRSSANLACRQLTTRLQSVPRRADSPTLILTPHALDSIVFFSGRCPESPIFVGAKPPEVEGIVMAHTESSVNWKSWLRSRAEQTWAAGGDVWLSRRAFAVSPPAASKWAEGDDPRFHWRDFPAFFAQFEFGPPVGGADGFVELLPTPGNRRVLEEQKSAGSISHILKSSVGR